MEFMHGDGDQYTEEQLQFTSVGELRYAIECLTLYENIDWNTRCDFRSSSSIYKFLNIPEPDYKRTDLSDQERVHLRVFESFPGDCMCDGDRLSMMRNYTVRYFNASGHQFDVKVTVS